jgi:signal peptidase I
MLREIAGILVASILVSLFIKTFVVQAFFVPSGSMEPTLHGCTGCLNDRLLVNKQTSRMGGVHRGDIVVFRDPGGWLPQSSSASGGQGGVHQALVFIGLAPTSNENNLVKRVIGVGGDTVEGRNGKVYVNGSELNEPYVFPGDSPSPTDFRVTVPAGSLWVMGDHRSDSSDSRAHRADAGKGFIPIGDVVGRAFVIVWPLGRASGLDLPATFERWADDGR